MHSNLKEEGEREGDAGRGEKKEEEEKGFKTPEALSYPSCREEKEYCGKDISKKKTY